MPPFLTELESACCRLDLPGRRLLVGVSGGADSVALLRGLVAIGEKLQLTLSVGHLDHALRSTSPADAEWVVGLCERLDVPCTVGRIDVGVQAGASGTGIEEAARDARYAFLQETALARGCSAIAVAHTADDQAETILHHVLRGTGLAGLRGIPERRALADELWLVRPMLNVTRQDVVEFLGSVGQDFRADETNADESLTRNRLRRSLLPQLESEYNPALRAALCRLGRQASETHAALEALAAGVLDRVIEKATATECRLRWRRLARQPRHLVREALVELWRRQGWPRQAMTYDHWERLAEIAISGGQADFPGGLAARRDARRLIVTHAAAQPARPMLLPR